MILVVVVRGRRAGAVDGCRSAGWGQSHSCYIAAHPPSMLSISPVTYEASFEAR